MNIFTIIFLQNFSKIFSKTHQITPFLKIFSGEHAPEPPYQTRGFAHFYKKNLNSPPRNEILDTPLNNCNTCVRWMTSRVQCR